MRLASRSMLECSASVRIATEPVRTPATTLSAIRIVFETIETAAARLRARLCGWAAVQRVLSHASSSRAARPRCEIASFSSSVSSAIVRPGVSSATKIGS